MSDLTPEMQKRLDEWREHMLPSKSAEKVRGAPPSRRSGKGDHGDVESLEDWSKEAEKSQRRK